MKSIYVPQSKLAQVKGVLKQFNKLLHTNGVSQLQYEISKPLVRDWYVTERNWVENKWVDSGIKKKVKLHKIDIEHMLVDIEGLSPVAFLNSKVSDFSDLLNEPVSCLSIAFKEKVLTPKELAIVFDENRYVICSHCNSHRKRDKAFVLSDNDGQKISYGASCVNAISGHSVVRIAKWCGYFMHLFDDMLKELSQLSRIVELGKKKGSTESVDVELFVSAVHSFVGDGKAFMSAKKPLPTYKRAMSAIDNEYNFRHSKLFIRFSAWVKKSKPKTQFHKKARFAFLEAEKVGVFEAKAAIIAALYNSFLQTVEYDFQVELAEGFYSGLVTVRSVEHSHKINHVVLRDPFGRLFSAEVSLNFPIGRLLLITGVISGIDRENGFPIYKLIELEEHQF